MTDADSAEEMLRGLRELPGAITRTYLAPDIKVMFESVNKNACTSLKWLMAELAGEDLARFRAGRRPFVSDSEAVHDRSLWIASPKLDVMSAEERRGIHPDNGWFIFGVVRDPRLRLFSAWQNKLLIETPSSQKWRDEPWYPHHPLTRESVIDDFASFVGALSDEPDLWLRVHDPHFRDQTELLAEHLIPYTRIYEIHELSHLCADLERHLAQQGHVREIRLPRVNPTPLHAAPEVFANGVREVVERIYAADFARFGDLWDFASVEAARSWTSAELMACEHESELGSRIAELHAHMTQARRRSDDAQDDIDNLKGRVARLEKSLAAALAAGQTGTDLP